MVVRTRDRIALTARELFNLEGEQNVAMVDIAMAMDISPGNLYYHYRGKEQLIPALVDLFEREIEQLLHAPLDNLDSLGDHWSYLYLLLEAIHNNRFIYNNLTDISQRDKSLARRFARTLALKRKTVGALCTKLSKQGHITLDAPSRDNLLDTLVLTLTYWLNYAALQYPNEDLSIRLHRGVYRLATLLAPYMNDRQAFAEHCRLLYQSQLPIKPTGAIAPA
ncbi:TetR/AcrR family transcriptional regulator [Exilibacterium tricleocarpae]|uniref:TetR/AcrR family transcriptional regulator n=1 Tax=Exilibacterium tricleocarpae TaxID=2591008 RepID=A0A545U5D3_9GAMM|nr:TetR/AcrR family transcriptional regulator [Exilibacterium tricleocarpae]TQV84685.1 TetR/AcrR family transcriptional regulator [Exilibacterium tricleocarpae]